MFWILFFTSMYWFIAFKLQANAYILLPSVDDWNQSYQIFYIVYGIVISFRFLCVVYKIIEQSTIDIFFIDWEKPNVQIKDSVKTEQVTAWRAIFLANEYNELQTEMRFLTPETTLLWFGFFLKGLGWENVAHSNPDVSTADYDLEPINFLLSFFISTFVFLCIGAV